MLCLSVRQPWAALIVGGLKTIEVRTWKTRYRGRILIHAGLIPDDRVERNTLDLLVRLDPKLVGARGTVVGAVDIIDCRGSIQEDGVGALHDIAPGRVVWILANPEIALRFIEIRGRLGLFVVDDRCFVGFGRW